MGLNIKPMNPQSAVMLGLLLPAAFLGNYFSVSLFFGVDFRFGSIAVLVALYFYGLKWGMAAAAIGSIHTYWLCGHWYAVIPYLMEPMIVGLLLRSGRRNLLLLDGLFWLIAGSPLVLLLSLILKHMDLDAALLLALKGE